jgi:two-component system sensor histidine kinase/response regulator
MKILVIEDDPIVREEVVDWLTFEDYTVLSASDGRQGRDIALAEVPDLIVSDISMPVLSGHEVLVELRQTPATAQIPFIFMTARTARNDVRFGMEIGAEDYVTKPFSHEELLGAVRTQLSKLTATRARAGMQHDEWRSVITHALPHELRTPLTVIMGYGESLAAGAETLPRDRIELMAKRILESSERLKHLIENYLTFAQLEGLRRDPTRSEAVVQGALLEVPDALVVDAANKVAYLHGRMNDLVVDMSAEINARITPEDLSKCVEELVDNAFKFSPPQTPVQVSSFCDDGAYVVQITNQGEGMMPEDIARIGAFAQFNRGVQEQQGLGLGMAIAKSVVELFGGTLSVDSKPDGDTTVSIALVSET